MNFSSFSMLYYKTSSTPCQEDMQKMKKCFIHVVGFAYCSHYRDSKEGAPLFGRVRGEALRKGGLIKQGLPCAKYRQRRSKRIISPHQSRLKSRASIPPKGEAKNSARFYPYRHLTATPPPRLPDRSLGEASRAQNSGMGGVFAVIPLLDGFQTFVHVDFYDLLVQQKGYQEREK
jgi:hypothetical protein